MGRTLDPVAFAPVAKSRLLKAGFDDFAEISYLETYLASSFDVTFVTRVQ